MRLELELSRAIELAREAGDEILKVYDQKYEVERKTGDEPVTLADRRANDLIVGGLRATFPSDAVLAEESADDGRRFCSPRVWLVDPLDGTEDFISHDDEFSVMIGLLVDGQPVVGVVYRPSTDLLYSAARDGGAFMEQTGKRRRLYVSEVSLTSEMTMACSRTHLSPKVLAVQEALGIRTLVRHGSAGLKVGLVCQQLADVYVNTGHKSREWDVCAPEAILREAGGVMTDLSGAPVQYNQKDVHQRNGVVVSNGRSHDRIIATIARVLGSWEPPGARATD